MLAVQDVSDNRPVIDILTDKGMNHENIEKAFSQMFSFFKHVQTLEKCIDTSHMTHIQGRGNLHADIVVVSGQPDDSEITTKFAGYSSYAMYLTTWFNRIGLNFTDIYWTNAIKSTDAKPSMASIQADAKYLKAELDAIDPSVIIAIGSTAISAFAGKPVRIEKALKETYSYEFHPNLDNVPVIPMTHPRSIIEMDKPRFQAETKRVWQQIKKLESIL